MSPKATETYSVLSQSSLAGLRDTGHGEEIQHTVVFKPSIPEKKGGLEGLRYQQQSKALRWALDRIAVWNLPGTEHVEEYFRSMYRRNFRPRTYASNLAAIHVFLTVVRDSGKTHLEEVTKGDIEAFIEHEQDRGGCTHHITSFNPLKIGHPTFLS